MTKNEIPASLAAEFAAARVPGTPVTIELVYGPKLNRRTSKTVMEHDLAKWLAGGWHVITR